jgi:hypothetical protein
MTTKLLTSRQTDRNLQFTSASGLETRVDLLPSTEDQSEQIGGSIPLLDFLKQELCYDPIDPLGAFA